MNTSRSRHGAWNGGRERTKFLNIDNLNIICNKLDLVLIE